MSSGSAIDIGLPTSAGQLRQFGCLNLIRYLRCEQLRLMSDFTRLEGMLAPARASSAQKLFQSSPYAACLPMEKAILLI
jgi:hypothetical protein